jgi:hypothetical protein
MNRLAKNLPRIIRLLMWKRQLCVVLVSMLSIGISPSYAQINTTACTTMGETKVLKEVSYRCQKLGKGLFWALIQSPNKKPSPSPSRTIPPVRVSCAAGGSCKVGDIGPGGGIVFIAYPDWQEEWELPRKWNVMEVAPPGWFGYPSDPIFNSFCPQEPYGLKEKFTEINNRNVGFGVFNTAYLAKYCPDGIAQLVTSYRGHGFKNWHIPSSIELQVLDSYSERYTTKKTDPQLKLDRVKYWSSSPSVVGLIRVYDFVGNNFYRDPSKLEMAGLRPVRQFATRPYTEWLTKEKGNR